MVPTEEISRGRKETSEHQLIRNVSPDRIANHIRILQGARHPKTSPVALEKAAQYISNELAKLGYEMCEHFFLDDGERHRNIIATSRGRGDSQKRVIVLAHYDTVAESPGADDNASGVSVLLELARVLKDCGFDKTVQFIAVDLEENKDEKSSDPNEGRRGSAALAKHARENSWDIVGLICLECVGYGGDNIVQRTPKGSPAQLSSIGDFVVVIGNETSAQLVQLITSTIERFSISLKHVPFVVPGNGEMLRDTRRSDHARFWDVGYESVFVTDTANFRNPYYHTPEDTLDTLSIPFATNVCRAIAGAVTTLAKLNPSE